jgi:hypothetical protein
VEGVPLGGDLVVRECTPPHTPTRPGALGDRARTWAGGASRGSPGVGRGALGPPLAWSSQVYGPGAVLNVLGEHRKDVPRAVQVSEAQHGGSAVHGLHAHPPQRSLCEPTREHHQWSTSGSGPPAAVGHQRQWCTESTTHPPSLPHTAHPPPFTTRTLTTSPSSSLFPPSSPPAVGMVMSLLSVSPKAQRTLPQTYLL